MKQDVALAGIFSKIQNNIIMAISPEQELEAAITKIVGSNTSKKVILAGPGAGKTTLFKRLLEKSHDGERNQLVLTFINNLKDELEEKLSHLSQVFTFHGYCVKLLHENPRLRGKLTDVFKIFPHLPTLIKKDWEILFETGAPQFVGNMRDVIHGAQTDFYLSRSDFYDTVGFDDSIFRVQSAYLSGRARVPEYKLVLVDEYQDFNRLEVGLINLLSEHSPIAVAGDDDQALYSQLKGASYEFIRGLWQSSEYEHCELPFCLRCPEVIVNAFADVIKIAREKNLLPGRIDKPYRYFAPFRGKDSAAHPKIKLLEISSQQLKTNYLGRAVARVIKAIPRRYILESVRDKFPTVLIIGPKQYLTQIAEYLRGDDFVIDFNEGKKESTKITRSMALPYLKEDPECNIGWRIALEADNLENSRLLIKETVAGKKRLVDGLDSKYKETVLAEAASWTAPEKAQQQLPNGQPTIKLTSYEGAKGLSAQYVFVVGLHNGDIPRIATDIRELEIFRFLVALTRTRKQCYLLRTGLFAGTPKQPSVFLRWINQNRLDKIRVDKNYWLANP